MSARLGEVENEYGHQWIISDGAGCGWYAVRRALLPDHGKQRGLSNVRCGRTLEELARHLAEERRLEASWAAPAQLWPHLRRAS
ncbi:hypothetical protein [Thermoactinospora rubra]|uniref:hypothetical protein n=1 Tax=Thermoactinospora rubra TaxID=1088767 RepID=UPI00117DEC0B|nr:hypothetical protein [Thermoactinospora rubra]